MTDKQAAEALQQLDNIKKLLILGLMEKGFTQKQLALTLGVGQGTISKMFPAGVLDKPRN